MRNKMIILSLFVISLFAYLAGTTLVAKAQGPLSDFYTVVCKLKSSRYHPPKYVVLVATAATGNLGSALDTACVAGEPCADCLQELLAPITTGCVIDKSDYVGLENVVYVVGCPPPV